MRTGFVVEFDLHSDQRTALGLQFVELGKKLFDALDYALLFGERRERNGMLF